MTSRHRELYTYFHSLSVSLFYMNVFFYFAGYWDDVDLCREKGETTERERELLNKLSPVDGPVCYFFVFLGLRRGSEREKKTVISTLAISALIKSRMSVCVRTLAVFSRRQSLSAGPDPFFILSTWSKGPQGVKETLDASSPTTKIGREGVLNGALFLFGLFGAL